uniref:Murine leukemia virus integrase C-terminal domain-containing protein n=1 Tax=Buteo japonicus TaxID=224669 RepID=A0A8C0ARF9_9AVES
MPSQRESWRGTRSWEGTQPGQLTQRDWVYVKSWTSEPPAEKWKGPYQVILTTYTAVKVWGKGPWLPYSITKKAPTGNWKSKETSPLKLKIYK